MTTQINQNNIQASTLAELGSGPTVTNIQITNSSYVVLDDTAVSTSGGYIKITGTNFASGCEVIIGSTNATAVSFVSSTVLNVQVPALSAGTYVVYVVNSDGSVAIRVNGLTSSGTPTWVTGSTLTGGTVNVAISIQLSATGDAPLTYTLASGSSLPSGLTLTSGGLLSGTVTGITVETIYNFTIDVTDAQSQESPRSFSITISVSDQYFPYVSSLLSATALTLPFNNDASTNNFAVTVVGDTRPNNFGPYTPGYYSNFFDGTGDYLTAPSNAAFNITSGSTDSFSCEFWVNFSTVGANMSIVDNGGLNGVSFPNWEIRLNASSQITMAWGNSGAPGSTIGTLASSTVPTVGQWYHIALVKTSADWSLFINGTRATTFNGLNTAAKSSSTALYIGFGIGTGAGGATFSGYISNLRIYNGATGSAPYSATSTTITVPTTPLTAIANTSLLTCQSNRFIDNSTNNFTITKNGDTLVSGFDPFTPSSSYSTYGSGYFDGTGDYLSVPPNSNLALGTGDFTVEWWYYPTDSGTTRYLLDIYDNNSSGRFLVQQNTDMSIGFYGSSAATRTVSTANALVKNIWNHIAICRNSGTTRIFSNGVQVNTNYSDSGNYTFTSTFLYFGTQNASGTQNTLGYCVDFRIIKGTGLYTTTFTPPTTPLTAVSGTSLLTLQTNQPANNNAFLDSSTNNFLVTRNNTTTQGTFSPYGPLWSNYFDGTGDYLGVTSNNAAFGLGTGDFTIECWVYATSNPANGPGTIFDLRTTVNASATAGRVNSSRQVMFYDGPANVETAFTNILLNLNTWSHIAWVRSGTTVTCYINGAVAGSVTVSSNLGTSQPCYIGTNQSPGYNWYGYVSNFRIVKGTAVYTSAFTPSTSPLTAIANTSLLTCTDNRLIDDSPNNFAITRAGDVSVQRFSPFSPQTVTTFYSGYFDGSGDFLTAPNTVSNFGTGDFTIECWFYRTSTGTTVLSNQDGGNTDNNYFTLDTVTAQATFQIRDNSSQAYAYGPATTTNTWTHLAVTRSSGTVRVFVNGVSGTSVTITKSVTSRQTIVGGFLYTGFEGYFSGYISNLRVIKGQALYTSTFTPSTSPLTTTSQGATASNVSLLTCQSATFIDNSTNNFTITVNGNSTPTTVSPFTPTATTNVAYSPSTYGGSLYYNVRTDSLGIPANALVKTFPGDFTFEAWVYPTDTSVSTWGLWDGRQDGQTPNPMVLNINPLASPVTGQGRLGYYNGTQYYGTGIVYYNTWSHVAWVRSGSTMTFYVNGIAGGTATISGTQTSNATSNPIFIGNKDQGAGASFGTVGYISDLRVNNGRAVYTSNFAPPVAPLTATQNSVLLLNGTGAGIYDMSMMNDYQSAGNSSLVTNIEKYGNSSLYFDGTGDYIGIFSPKETVRVWWGKSFTIEFWIYGNAWQQETVNTAPVIIGNMNPSGGSQNYWSFGPLTNGTVRWYYFNGSGQNITTTTALSTGQWYHLAFVNNNGSIAIYINGTSSATGTVSGTPQSGVAYPICVGSSNGVSFNGYLDDLRITNGVARYTSNFTPTSSPFIAS
jgi:hypothetical protein